MTSQLPREEPHTTQPRETGHERGNTSYVVDCTPSGVRVLHLDSVPRIRVKNIRKMAPNSTGWIRELPDHTRKNPNIRGYYSTRASQGSRALVASYNFSMLKDKPKTWPMQYRLEKCLIDYLCPIFLKSC